MKIKGKFALVAGALATMLAVSATPASAADGVQYAKKGSPSGDHLLVCAELTGAVGCFQPYGEYFWVGDTRPDGTGPQLQWSSSSGRGGKVVSNLGNGTWGYVNKSFGESTNIRFRVCLGTTCSAYREESAGTQ